MTISKEAIEAMRPHIEKLRRCVPINDEMGRVVTGQTEAITALAEIFDKAEAALPFLPIAVEGKDWKPISSAPKDGTEVDLWCVRHTGKPLRVTDMWWTESTGWRNGNRDTKIEALARSATHWRLPPSSPGNDGGQEVDLRRPLQMCVDMLKSNGFGVASVVEVAERALAASSESPDCCDGEDCQYAKAVSMPEYRCVGKCQYSGRDGGQEVEAVGNNWHDGTPPKPWCDEWFIAQTTYGDRVVLTALPEEWAYDFKTADDTYIKADRIKRWMQFPDSQFLAYHPASTALVERAAAFDQIVSARKAHVDAVSAYNARLEFVRAERMRGSWLTVDKEYAASTEAERSYLRITRELADAALYASQSASREEER